jgi:sarcosine reductase
MAADFGDKTALQSGTLTVSTDDANECFRHRALASVHLSWAHPGESVRIVKVLDAVEPRTKGPGGGGIFPGMLGPATPQGEGSTSVLQGVAVVTAGYIPRAQQGLVQMSGPHAELSPLGSTHNLVVEFEPDDGAPWPVVAAALRVGLLRLAATLAEAALEQEADQTDELARISAKASSDLPRIGTIANLQTQGDFKDVYVYGRSMSDFLPSPIDPNELEDGAVVSGQYGHPGLKNPTYLHQNNPVVAALRERDGSALSFAGLILSPEPVDQKIKELASAHAARLCYQLGWDAAIVTKEGGGNADSDISLKVDALEAMGIAGIGIFPEMSGANGLGPPVVSPPATATAMISAGNYDERITLEAVERALGGETYELTGSASIDEMQLPSAVVYCGLSPLGWGRLTCAEPEAAA